MGNFAERPLRVLKDKDGLLAIFLVVMGSVGILFLGFSTSLCLALFEWKTKIVLTVLLVIILICGLILASVPSKESLQEQVEEL